VSRKKKAEQHRSGPVPSVDQKFWLMADVNPNEYETRDGKRVMKDWAQAEFDERIGKSEPEVSEAEKAAKEEKRAKAQQVRLLHPHSLTPEEISRIESAVVGGMTRARAEESGLVLP